MRLRFEYGKLSEVTRHDLMKVHLEEAKNHFGGNDACNKRWNTDSSDRGESQR